MAAPVAPPPDSSGSIPFTINGGTFQTHYRVWGDISPTRVRPPLVVLHGGPGCASNYMEPFVNLHTSYGIPIVLYDQLGCGLSLPDPVKDKKERELMDSFPSDFWQVDVFEKELDNLLSTLGLADDFDLLGNSWGGMLAAQYVIDYQPKGLKHLIITNSSPDVKDWVKSTWQIMKSEAFGFPREIMNIVKFAEKHSDAKESMTAEEWDRLDGSKIDLDSQEYLKAKQLFMATFVCRTQPFPDSYLQTLDHISRTPVITAMWGPSWCNPTGTLLNWSIKDSLHKINVPTLIYNGFYEQAQDWVVYPYFEKVPKVKWVTFMDSSHAPHYEEHEKCMKLIAEFVKAA